MEPESPCTTDDGAPECGEDMNAVEVVDASAPDVAGPMDVARPLRRERANGNLRTMFASQAAVTQTFGAVTREEDGNPGIHSAAVRRGGADLPGGGAGNALLSAPSSGIMQAMKLSPSRWQQVSESCLSQAPAPLIDTQEDNTSGSGTLETKIFTQQIALGTLQDVIPLLEATIPVLPSGRAIFSQLPAQWINFSGRSDALGTRSMFASRRHEHSVFPSLKSGELLRVPVAARKWSPTFSVPQNALEQADLASEEPWSVDVHPVLGRIRVLVRPGVLLLKSLRKGTALPDACFTWRVTDSSSANGTGTGGAAMVPQTEFSILSNLEDAAHAQPPRFEEYPLRREQLRSLGWMISQEKRRREPFVTELREAVPCPDAPHWRLESSLRCEYRAVKGGVLADAIGYGKTACTIGLIDCTKADAPPRVPVPFQGFIPTRATLVLCPTNLHAQWLAEIVKFAGQTLKVVSVPTCAQLKRLTVAELRNADVVVATYRLFYSSPYLRRLEELARSQRPDFAFPVAKTGGHGARPKLPVEWAQAYRKAFELLPAWSTTVQPAGPVTPVRPAMKPQAAEGVTGGKEEQQPVAAGRRRKSAAKPVEEEAKQEQQPVAAGRRRRKPAAAKPVEEEATQAYSPEEAVQVAEEATEAINAEIPASAEPTKKARRRYVGKQSAGIREEDASSAAGAAAQPSGLDDLGARIEDDLQYVPLEAFWWRRVVCDEFHELLIRYPPAQTAVELFHADYKWGLSGTPPCQTLAQIRKAAGFLGVQIPTSAEDGEGEAPRQVAQEWLDAFARRNTAELPPLQEEERIIPVRQTPRERALYLALTEQANPTLAEAAVEAAKVSSLKDTRELTAAKQSASGLLKLCSHFCPSGAADILSAEDECQRQLALRREQLRTVVKEAKGLAERAASTVELVRHFEPHFCREPTPAAYGVLRRSSKAVLAARLKFLGAPATGSKAELANRLFSAAASAGEAAKDMVLRPDFAAQPLAEEPPTPSWAGIETAAAACSGGTHDDAATGQELVARVERDAIASVDTAAKSRGEGYVPQRCARLRVNLGMPRVLAANSREDKDAQRDFEDEDWAWRQEKEAAQRLRTVVDDWKADIERCCARLKALEGEASTKLAALHSFQEKLRSSEGQGDDAAQSSSKGGGANFVERSRFAKYGSKIEAIVMHVQKLQVQDPGCKVICFVQWEDLKRKIGSALVEFEIDHLALQGSVWARRSALTRFQYDEESPRILLLSLEESASGTNLTAANHVIIVHPMDATTSEEAVAFEMQAVGRVRRPGQTRKIHVWRFVTIDTIEQRITEEHQKELWERQRAKILVTPSQVQTQGDDGSDSDMDGGAALGQAAAEEPPATQMYEGDASEEPAFEADCSTQAYVAWEHEPEPTGAPTVLGKKAGGKKATAKKSAAPTQGQGRPAKRRRQGAASSSAQAEAIAQPAEAVEAAKEEDDDADVATQCFPAVKQEDDSADIATQCFKEEDDSANMATQCFKEEPEAAVKDEEDDWAMVATQVYSDVGSTQPSIGF